ncbi:hypothetical protein V7S43_004628 [Phytophthora oleae]|uniref:Little elongation complex subunit 2 C-terminal domain-containing protein n=1 Tax=Phytophthora oleae TaxID=2107226 RepID=A0ABD3FVB4_9STRA
MEATSAFAVPRRLFAGHKRRAEGSNAVDSSAFFTSDEYDAFSVHGDAHESRLYAELETRRRTLVATINSCKNIRKSSPAMEIKHQSKHLVLLLVEAIANGHIEAPEKMLELDNSRRRVSGFSVAEHERYLLLQRKLFQAQQRGLPEVLALSQDEAKQWQQMKADVEKEQIGFCRMMTRGLAAEAAANEALVPSFASSWFMLKLQYNSMLTQCWNDIYRLYPRWFEPCVEVTLPTGEIPVDSCSAVIKAKEVAARGSYCAVDLRRLVAGQPLMANGGESGGLDVVSPRLAISADAQAAQLMDEYDCHLAISSSTLVTLFDSDTSTRFAHVPVGWGIPMKSRTNAHGTCGATKKRIFLDRPLPGNSSTTREKMADAGRAALLSRFETDSVTEGSTGGRTVYYIWELDGKRILVRSTTHAAMVNGTEAGESNTLATSPLSVFVKPDYHSLRTEEQLTTSERCRFWLHSWLRGGSTVLVVRVNPRKDAVTSWKTYSPTSLLFGDNALSLPLECFDPSLKFQWLSTLFSALGDVPVGNYLLRARDGNGQSTFGRKRGGVEVLMATESPVVDLYSFMPKTAPQGPASVVSTPNMPPIDPVLPSWNLRDRIPYTFQTGMYCVPFFLEGTCPNVSKEGSCDHMHLRVPEPCTRSKKAKVKRWKFENYTKVLKKATRTNFEVLDCPVEVTLNYAFCGEDKVPPTSPTIADLHAPVHCSKPPGGCLLPHFTLHQILERLADELLRQGRGKRRSQKNGYRQQRRTAERLNH